MRGRKKERKERKVGGREGRKLCSPKLFLKRIWAAGLHSFLLPL